MEQARPVLRPLTVAEIIDAAFRLYLRNFVTLFSIAAVFYVPIALIQAGLVALVLFPSGMLTPDETVADVAAAIQAASGMAVLVVLRMIAYAFVYAALAVAISRIYLGHAVTVGSAYSRVLPRILPFVATWFLSGLLVTFGVIFCIVPGIYLAVALAFALPLVVLERLGPVEAMSRSMDLARGYWWRIFGTLLLLGLIVLVIQGALMTPFSLIFGIALSQFAAAQAVHQFLSVLLDMLLLPVTMTALIVLYYDLRVRKEAFDLQLMADQIGKTVGEGPGLAGPPPGEVSEGPSTIAELPPPPDEREQEPPGPASEEDSTPGVEAPPPPGHPLPPAPPPSEELPPAPPPDQGEAYFPSAEEGVQEDSGPEKSSEGSGGEGDGAVF